MHLATLRTGAPKRHGHVRAHGWTVTSNVPIEALLDAEVLDRALPGWLGRYVLPSDAVVHYDDGRRVDWDALIASETLPDEDDAPHNHHVVSAEAPPPPPLPEESDEEEDESEEEEEGSDADSVHGWTDDEDQQSAAKAPADDEDDAAVEVRGGAHRGPARPAA